MNQAFFPAFGHRPAQLAGREQEISDFLRALATKPGDWRRATFISGYKGMGKTALALELADWATAQGYEVLNVNADEDWSAAFAQLSVQRDKVLAVVDDVHNPTSSLRSLASAYRTMSSRGRSVALIMCGEPKTLEALQKDSVLSALQLSQHMRLKALPLGKVEAALEHGLAKTGVLLGKQDLHRAASATKGHPYLMQLVGAYLSGGAMSAERACSYAQRDFIDAVIDPMLGDLSSRDTEVLRALAALGGEASTAQLLEQLGMGDNHLQPYRARLLKAGMVSSPRRGQLVFALPYLAEALAE